MYAALGEMVEAHQAKLDDEAANAGDETEGGDEDAEGEFNADDATDDAEDFDADEAEDFDADADAEGEFGDED